MQMQQQDNWIQTSLGQKLVQQEQLIYDHAVVDVFGFHAVQVGLPQINCLKDSRIPNIVSAGVEQGNLLCDSSYLPFALQKIALTYCACRTRLSLVRIHTKRSERPLECWCQKVI